MVGRSGGEDGGSDVGGGGDGGGGDDHAAAEEHSASLDTETWRSVSLEGWKSSAFQIEEPHHQEQHRLVSPFSVDASEEVEEEQEAASLLPGGSQPSRLHKTVSRVTLLSETQEDSWAAYRHEAGRIVHLALPIAASHFCGFALSLISVSFVGRLGQQEMAVAVLASSVMNVTGYSVVMGLLGACDTLCGQAWGAKNYPALGVTLQKAVLTTLAVTLCISGLWCNTEGLLLAAGQDPAIARGAARYLLLAIPGLVLLGLFECVKRYLMAQGVVQPVMAVTFAAVVLAPLYNWLFIFRFGLGLDGAVFALVACQVSSLAMVSAYLLWHERRRRGTPEQTWHGWSRDCLKGLGTYMKLAVPSTLMVCLEWWAYELCIIMAGWLPEPDLHVAVMGVMLQVSGLCYMGPMGLSSATTVRVGNALGAGLPRSARRTAYTATALTVVLQVTLATVVFLGRDVWGAVFTNIEAVITTAASVFPLLCLALFGDGMNATVGGVLRGAGRQELGAIFNACSYWVIGIPTSYLLSIKAGLGIAGLWGGLLLCTSVEGLVMIAALLLFDWQAAAERADQLVAASVGGGEGGGGKLAVLEDSAAKLHPGGGGGGGGGSLREPPPSPRFVQQQQQQQRQLDHLA